MIKQNKRKHKNTSIILGIVVTILVMITLLGLTYAYYRTRVVGNKEEEKSINNPSKILKVIYEDDNPEVVTDPLYAPGRKVSKEFKVTNVGDDTGNYSIILDNIENTLERTWDIRYILKDKKTNEELVKGTLGKELEKQMVYADIEIGVGTTNEYVFELEYEETNEDQSEDMGKLISFKIDIIEAHENIFEDIAGGNTLLYAIGRDNEVVKPLTTPGQQVSTADEAELSYTEDDYGTSYYFRGNVQNNYVTFNNMCWRIVRVLGNGDIKLSLASEKGECKEENITEKSAFINDGETFSYAKTSLIEGILYENSQLKEKLEEWYDTHFENTNVTNLIEEAKWCNDVSVMTVTGGGIEFGRGADFSGGGRMTSPSIKCIFKSIANKWFAGSILVPSKIGALTMDEVIFRDPSYCWNYACYGEEYPGVASEADMAWTITPFRWDSAQEKWRDVFAFITNDSVHDRDMASVAKANPSIVLKRTVIINDNSNGTLENPYVIS